MKNFRAVVYVLLGAVSYGLLATIVKYANHLGIGTSALTFWQFFIGFVFLIVLDLIWRKRSGQEIQKVSFKSKSKLILWGTSLGLTTTLYYISIQYVPVSVGIILLMQSIWISLVLEIVIHKKRPNRAKIVGVIIVLIGTLLATNIFDTQLNVSIGGLLLGLGAGASYALSLFASSSIALDVPSHIRSKYLVFGGLILIILFWNVHIIQQMSVSSLYWGIAIAIFGTILPPLLFTKGIPEVGISLGNILASLEIPVSILSAVIILNESVEMIQWGGILLILFAIILINKRVELNLST